MSNDFKKWFKSMPTASNQSVNWSIAASKNPYYYEVIAHRCASIGFEVSGKWGEKKFYVKLYSLYGSALGEPVINPILRHLTAFNITFLVHVFFFSSFSRSLARMKKRVLN